MATKNAAAQKVEVATTLQQRRNTHGDYALTSEIIQQQKQ